MFWSRHRAALVRAARRALRGQLSMVSGGVALFALLATLPTLAALVSIYGLVADPQQIEVHLSRLNDVLPAAVVTFLVAELEREAARASGALGFALATSVLLAIWSAMAAVGALVDALHLVYGEDEKRALGQRTLVRLVLALGVIATLVGTAGVFVALPAIAVILPGRHVTLELIALLRWPGVMILHSTVLVVLYRLSVTSAATKRRLWPGAMVGTTLWLITSWGLSFYVSRVANYENLYGAFGSVMVVLLWFYLSAVCVMIGGLLNGELEKLEGAEA